ncbi:hypothetical protein [Lentzea sp. CA-135723]|uniref:hypothetical protein n=1 Tax=Lentzea sp. CA-135723 TaxID=3239950 RepID=UPI003D9135E1
MRRSIHLGLVLVLLWTSVGVVPASAAPETQTRDGMSVTVSQTSDLVRQRVKVSWSGLTPTKGSGANASYPVAIMQCWGAPAEVTQQRCWSAGRAMEPATFIDTAPWDPVQYGDYGDLGLNLATVLSFTARDGKRYSWEPVQVDDAGVPVAWPDGSVRAGAPPDLTQDTYNFIQPPTLLGETRADGKGAVDIELLPAEQLPSLGCSDTAACSLVVVPIGEPRCNPDLSGLVEDWALGCEPGAENSSLRSAATWKSPVNWEKRFTFPLSFRKTQQVCAQDDREETGLSGSPYLNQLMSSWRPKFCLDGGLFKLGYTSLGEGDARRQFLRNLTEKRADGVNAVLTSRPPDGEASRPVVYAPVAVTGFTVAYLLDDAAGAEVGSLNLTPRLLLKMLTQSYTGAAPGIETHPAIAGNPAWWGSDPELAAANPGLALRGFGVEPSAYPLLVQGDLDLTWALTAYIASDPAAVAWLGGAPDEWGMKVNPKFQATALPFAAVELRDDWKVPATSATYKNQLWFNLIANQVPSVVASAVALVQGRPMATTNESLEGDRFVYKRPERQQTGSRALLAVTDLADTSVFGLRSASLRTRTGEYVAPNRTTMAFGLNATTIDAKTGILQIDQSKVDGRAYPGTSLVYAGVPTSQLPQAQADRYATFLEYAAGAGQDYGIEIGKLPDGYLALTDPLRQQARDAAKAVREQKGVVPPPPPAVVDNPAGLPIAGRDNVRKPENAPVPSSVAPPSPAPSSTAVTTSSSTRADSSAFGRWALPVLLGLGLLAGLVAPLVPAVSSPEHPLRRLFRRRSS